MDNWVAIYQCLNCDNIWTQKAGPTECGKCHNFHNIRWANYKSLYKANVLDKGFTDIADMN